MDLGACPLCHIPVPVQEGRLFDKSWYHPGCLPPTVQVVTFYLACHECGYVHLVQRMPHERLRETAAVTITRPERTQRQCIHCNSTIYFTPPTITEQYSSDWLNQQADFSRRYVAQE